MQLQELLELISKDACLDESAETLSEHALITC